MKKYILLILSSFVLIVFLIVFVIFKKDSTQRIIVNGIENSKPVSGLVDKHNLDGQVFSKRMPRTNFNKKYHLIKSGIFLIKPYITRVCTVR